MPIRARLAKAGDGAIDESRVASLQALISEAKALGRNRVALSSLLATEPATPADVPLPQVQVAS